MEEIERAREAERKMGGCMKKCVEKRETAVVELEDLGDDGVRTRPIMPAMASDLKDEESSWGRGDKRRRDTGDAELANSSFVEVRSTRRRVVIKERAESVSPENGSPSCGPLTYFGDTICASEPVSCSLSRASVGLVGDRSTFADLTGQTESAQLETLTFSGGIEGSRTTPLSTDLCPTESGSLESMAPARPSKEANSRHKSTTVSEMPSELEIEEFFSAAEKDLQKRFSERYNFDIVKGVPLEGRYEWVREKP